MKTRNWAATTVLAGISLLSAGNTYADSYAFASTHITNLIILNDVPELPVSATFKLHDSASIDSIAGSSGFDSSISSGVAPFDITQAYQGQAGDNPGENSFVQNINNIPGSNYARGDTSIVTSALNPGGPPGAPTLSGFATESWNVAESYLTTPDVGRADAQNSSEATFDFTLDPGAIFTISFNATPILIACVNGNTGAGDTCGISNPLLFPSTADAELSTLFSITDSLGATVFEWAPGTLPTIGDGGGSINPFSLNTTVGRTQSNTGQATYNPGTGFFSATTTALIGGNYTLTSRTDVDLDTELKIPEPGILSLIGIGLAGIGFGKRRKQKLAA